MHVSSSPSISILVVGCLVDDVIVVTGFGKIMMVDAPTVTAVLPPSSGNNVKLGVPLLIATWLLTASHVHF